MSAGKAIKVLQEHDSFDLRREIERWLRLEGYRAPEAVILAIALYPHVRDYGAGVMAALRDALEFEGLTLGRIREGLDFARERGWDL